MDGIDLTEEIMFSKKSQISSMPNGSFSTSLPDGGRLSVKRHDATQEITFTDKDKNEMQMTLQIASYDYFRKQAFYREVRHDHEYDLPVESLVSDWETKKGYGWIMKHPAQGDALAVTLFSDRDLTQCLDKLTQYWPYFLYVSYITEKRFCALLTKYWGPNKTVRELRILPGMGEARIQLLCHACKQVDVLLQHENIERLGLINQELLTLLLRTEPSVLQKVFVLFEKGEFFHLSFAQQQLLINRPDTINLLIDHLLTLDEFKALDAKALKKCDCDVDRMKTVLHFVTPQQLCGINHVPCALPSYATSADVENPYEFWGSVHGTDGPLSYRYNDRVLVLKYHHQDNTVSMCKFTFKLPEVIEELSKVKEKYLPTPLVFDWYARIYGSQSNAVRETLFFCPYLKLYVIEECDITFPQAFYDSREYLAHFKYLPFLQERAFILMLSQDVNISIQQLTGIKGMTPDRLALLIRYDTEFKELLFNGLTLDELVVVDLARLKYVLQGFSEARWALKFVNVRELLGLGKEEAHYSPIRFYAQPEETPAPETTLNQPVDTCRLM